MKCPAVSDLRGIFLQLFRLLNCIEDIDYIHEEGLIMKIELFCRWYNKSYG